MNAIIAQYKKIRKKRMLKKKYIGKYAFIGIGNHSMNNLYPILNYLNVDIKYIVVHSEDTADLIRANFPDVIALTSLEAVLKDEMIKGVFVSANPLAHFSLAKQVLKANKNLFIEKPPCASLQELAKLIAIEAASKGEVLTGLQKRYAPVYTLLKNKVRKANYYTLKYKTGGYPEGDELLDLFIHPLDAMFFLFGSGEIESVKVIQQKGTLIYLAQIQHQNGVCGSLEFSTAHSWTGAQDILVVNTPKGEYITENTSQLSFQNKPKVLMGIPLEKVKKFVSQTRILYQQNSFLPVKEHNQLYAAGYFNEMVSFLNMCEKGSTANQSPLLALTDTFEAIDQLRKAKKN
jgi:virulence factor